MKSPSLVSIVVPVYNAEKYLNKAIESFMGQTYKQIEIILVNDGSTDNSQQIINEYEKKDGRIRSITTDNKGAPHARNTGLDSANGEYIIFFDADDMMLPDEIELLCNGAGEGIDLVIGSRKKMTEDGKIFQTDKLKDGVYDHSTDIMYLISISPFPNNKLYSKKVLIDNNIRFHNVRIAQDANVYIKYLSVCRKVRTISEPVCLYRIVDNSISRTYSKKVIDIIECVENISRYVRKHGADDLFITAMNTIFVKYCYGQIMKIGYMNDKPSREEVLNTIGKYVLDKADQNTLDNEKSEKYIVKIRRMMAFKKWYTSSLYCVYRKTVKWARQIAAKLVVKMKYA